MKICKKIISVLCIVAMLTGFVLTAFSADDVAASTWSSAYNNDIKNVKYVTSVENQATEDDCVIYALLAAAETYCIKNDGVSADKLNFSEKALRRNVSSYNNFGDVLYSAVYYSLGKNYYLTGIENLTERGDYYLKHKIIENGAVVAAIALPEKGMINEKCYSKDNACFYCDDGELSSSSHAIEIVGWDDNYSTSNFSSTANPHKNGAWLCKNSYGTDYGDGGFFWLSYRYDFLYTASVEVSKFDYVIKVKNGLSSFALSNIAAFGFRYCYNTSDAEVIASIGDKEVFKGNLGTVNGYNFIPLEKSVKYGDIKVSVNGEDIPSSAVSRYLVLGKNNTLSPSVPSKESNWLKPVENITVNTKDVENPKAITGNLSHKIACNPIDNIWYITPADGYYFDDSTVLNLTARQYGVSDDIREFSKVSESEYAKLDSDGRISIKSLTIGSAYVDGVDIVTDEKGEITAINLLYDYGAKKTLANNEYTINKVGEDDEGYKVSIDVNGYYADPFGLAVYVDGLPVENGCATDGNKFNIKTYIVIPKVRANIMESTASIFGALFNLIYAIFK